MSIQNFKVLFQSLVLIGIVLSLSSCLKDDCTSSTTYINYEPQYQELSIVRGEVNYETSRPFKDPGKIYFYKDMILINERNEGIHFVDNSDPTNPHSIGFLSIIGNIDMAIKDNVLYADAYMDLLSIDISDIANPEVTCRDLERFGSYHISDNRILVGYSETDVTLELSCDDPNFGQEFFWVDDVFWVNESSNFDNNNTGIAGGSGAPTGVGGSFARFGLVNDHLYVIDQNNLHSLNVENPSCPAHRSSQRVSWGEIETLFPYEDKLFIGGVSGMHIYENSFPDKPNYLSTFRHARACDPVFVQGDLAYVTLRDGTRCDGFANQLDVIDVSDLLNPTLMVSHPLTNPHGLSVRSDILYICDGSDGLKVFDKSNVDEITQNQLAKIDVDAYDVISLSEDHLLLIGKEGLFQYDSSDPSNLVELSRFSVEF